MEEERSVDGEDEDELQKIKYKTREIAEPQKGSADFGKQKGNYDPDVEQFVFA